MKCLCFELVVWLSVVLLEYSFTQECGVTHTIQSSGLTTVNINHQNLPACFVCPEIAESFTINLETMMNAPPDVFINDTILIIYNWFIILLSEENLNLVSCATLKNEEEISYTSFFNFIGDVASKCDVSNVIGSTEYTPIDINNTNTTFCFECPERAGSFILNDTPLTSNPPDINIFSTAVIVRNWSALPLNLSDVNRISCTNINDRPLITLFYSLIPGPLRLLHNKPLYVEGESEISVLCVNPNHRPGYATQNATWKDSKGRVVSNGRNLTLMTTLDNAGIYTCSIPSVPLILSISFEVVIRPHTSTTISTFTTTSSNTTTEASNLNTIPNIIVADRCISTGTHITGIMISIFSTITAYTVILLITICCCKYRIYLKRNSDTKSPKEDCYEVIESQKRVPADSMKLKACAAYDIVHKDGVSTTRVTEEHV